MKLARLRLLARGAVTIPSSVPTDTEPSRVAAEQVWPRLRVGRVAPGMWWWQIVRPDGTGQGKAAATHAEALAVGMAALEVASVR